MRLIDADDQIQILDNAYMEKLADADPITILRMSLLAGFARDVMRYAPTIDAVPVVRCKDCKWWGDLDPKNRYTDCYCHVVECSTEPDWFCADGERKDDDSNLRD